MHAFAPPRPLLLSLLLLTFGAPSLADEPELPPFTPSPPPVPARARLHDPPSVDPRPGPWACNVQTLLDEIDCVLAGRVPPEAPPAAVNERLFDEVSGRLCDELVRETRDPPLALKVRGLCKERAAELRPLCTVGGTRLTDDGRHFGREHGLCYAALLGVVREIRSVGQTWAPCCACLVNAGCSPAFRACADDIARCRKPQRERGPGCDAARCEATCRATELLATGPTEEKR